MRGLWGLGRNRTRAASRERSRVGPRVTSAAVVKAMFRARATVGERVHALFRAPCAQAVCFGAAPPRGGLVGVAARFAGAGGRDVVTPRRSFVGAAEKTEERAQNAEWRGWPIALFHAGATEGELVNAPFRAQRAQLMAHGTGAVPRPGVQWATS